MKLWVVVFVLSINMLSCNIFDLRTANKPSGIIAWNSYANSYEKCLENLLYSFNYKENVYKYSEILAENFRFEFDQQDINYHSIPEFWDKKHETDMLLNFHQQINVNQSVSLEIFPIDNLNDEIRDRMVIIYREYFLTITNNRYPGDEHHGKLEIVFEKESNGLWKIIVWRDYRIQNNKTWGRMKNEYSV